MNAAEKLRNELKNDIPFTKDEFIEYITERIRLSGRVSFICDHHIGETKINHGNTIRLCHEQAIREFATSEGFRISESYNGYGVRSLVFSI